MSMLLLCFFFFVSKQWLANSNVSDDVLIIAADIVSKDGAVDRKN